MSEKTHPSATVTRKPDDEVGTRGSRPAAGGHQTAEQAAITEQGPDGRSDTERSHERTDAGGAAGRNPAPIGGSSSGQSDQHSAAGRGKVAGGHYDVEKEPR